MGSYKFKSIGWLVALLFSSLAFAEVEQIGPFGGLNNTDSSFVIPLNVAQDLLNVEVSDDAKSVKKRKGYGTAFTLSNATSPVHGIYNFYDTNGSDVFLYFNDRNMNVSVSGGSPTVFFSTGSNGATYQCTDSAGFAYCANTSRDSIVKVNSSTYSLLSGFTSTGTMVAVTQTRLVQAGFSSTTNLVWFSKANDFTTWTTGGNPVDPIQFTIVSPGSGIKHIVYAHGRLYWFKDASFGYILEGQTQADWRVVTISAFLGNLNNTSIYKDEILYFQGNDGHFYAYDGSNLVQLSRDIQTTISQTQGRTTNSWTQTSASDWNNGSVDTSLYYDTTTTNGSITTLYPDTFGSFRNGANGTRNVWETAVEGGSKISISTASNNLAISLGSFSTSARYAGCVRNSTPIASVTTGATYYTDIVSLAVNSGTPRRHYFLFKESSAVDPANIGAGTVFYIAMVSSDASHVTFEYFFNSGTVSQIQMTTTTLSFGLSFFLGSSSYAFTVNGSSVIKSGSNATGLANLYASYCIEKLSGVDLSTFTSVFDNFTVVPQTFTFSSQVNNAASLTSNDSFSASAITTGGSQTFSYRARQGQFTINSSTPTYETVNNGDVPVSTGVYFQIRDFFQVTTTNSIRLDSFTQNWFEGAASDKTYATYHDNANWWSVASGTGATTNNKILRFDLLYPGWYIYDIGTGGMYVRNQSLYFGSVSAGKIYKYGDAESDDGAAINSYWKSKDFFGVSPFLDKDYTRLSSAHSKIANSTMTVTYTIDGSSTTSYSVNLGSATSAFIQKNVNLPQGKTGKTINVQFGNNAANQQWETFGGQVDYNPKSWVPK